MAEIAKVDGSPALTALLALGCRGGRLATQTFAKHQVADKLSTLRGHAVVQKIAAGGDVILMILGLSLILHGVHFKKLLLCAQVVTALCWVRMKDGATGLYSQVTVALEKMKDEPVATGDEHPANADTGKQDVAFARKVLKAVDAEAFTTAALSVLASFMACLLVARGGLVQGLVVGHALVGFFTSKVHAFVEFPGYEDVRVWTDLLVRSALYVFCVGLALSAAPLALAMNASACGAGLLVEHGLRVAEALGKVEGAGAFAASKHGLLMLFGLSAFGTLWQLWTWMAGSGMAWYVQVPYLPAILAEGVLGLL